MRQIKFWGLLGIALLLGLLITWVDSQPGWDDTGITAAAIFGVTALLGAAAPERPWVWSLAIGGWIPALAILVTHNYGAFLALAIAFAGSYVGAHGRKAIVALTHIGSASS